MFQPDFILKYGVNQISIHQWQADFPGFWYNFSPCSTRRGVHFEEEKPEKPPERRGKLVTDPSSTMGYTDYTDPPIPPKRLF